MNVADLEDALAAFTADTLTDITSVSDVLVADAPRSVRKPSIDAVWTLVDERPRAGEGGIGRPVTELEYEVVVTAGSVTQEGRKQWGRELRDAIHQRRVPAGVAGLHKAEVLDWTVGPAQNSVGVAGGTGGAQLDMRVVFVGDVDAPGAYTPPRAGLVLWLDASDASTFHLDDDDGVLSWRSKVGGHAYGQGDETLRPTRQAALQNDLPGVTFALPTSPMFSQAAPVIEPPFTVIVVAKGADGTLQGLVDFVIPAAPLEGWSLLFAADVAGDPVRLRAKDASGTTNLDVAGATPGAAFVAVARVAAADDRALSVDGGAEGTSAVSRAPDIEANNYSALGVLVGEGYGLNGDLYEVLVYDRDLTDAEVASRVAGLSNKWGV